MKPLRSTIWQRSKYEANIRYIANTNSLTCLQVMAFSAALVKVICGDGRGWNFFWKLLYVLWNFAVMQITLMSNAPMQVDGEPWEQHAATMTITHYNQASMLASPSAALWGPASCGGNAPSYVWGAAAPGSRSFGGREVAIGGWWRKFFYVLHVT